MSFKLSNTYLKLFIMTAAASAMLVGSECLHRLYFDIVPLGRPWEEFLYLLTFTSILCFSRWAFTKVCAAFFLFLCLIVNPVHFEVYQSWINGINYYLALAEWSEVANTGVSMIPKGSSSKPPSLNDGGADLFKRVTFDQVLKSVESSRER